MNVFAVSGAVTSLPLVGLMPDHAPAGFEKAAQLSAFVDVHDTVVDAPVATSVGLAVSCTVGRRRDTVMLRKLSPPGPVQLKVNRASLLRGPTVSVPLKAFVPVHPSDAVQLVTTAVVHVNVMEPPTGMPFDWLAVRLMRGRLMPMLVREVAVPNGPVHVSTNSLGTLMAGDCSEPLNPFEPDQLPDAVQLFVLEDRQVSSTVCPGSTKKVDAVRTTSGGPATVTVALLLSVPPGPVHVKP